VRAGGGRVSWGAAGFGVEAADIERAAAITGFLLDVDVVFDQELDHRIILRLHPESPTGLEAVLQEMQDRERGRVLVRHAQIEVVANVSAAVERIGLALEPPGHVPGETPFVIRVLYEDFRVDTSVEGLDHGSDENGDTEEFAQGLHSIGVLAEVAGADFDALQLLRDNLVPKPE